MRGRSCKEVLDDFLWTWDEHRGDVLLAAMRVDMKPESLSRALYRAKRRGYSVEFRDTSKRIKKNG
jgi:hypothetical protein